jgi:hypothetical protein
MNSYDGLEELWPVQYVYPLGCDMMLMSSMDIDYIRVYRMSPAGKISELIKCRRSKC